MNKLGLRRVEDVIDFESPPSPPCERDLPGKLRVGEAEKRRFFSAYGTRVPRLSLDHPQIALARYFVVPFYDI